MLLSGKKRLADESEPLYRASSVWNWPNFDPIRQQGIDIMHLEGLGLLEAHIELLGLTKEEFRRYFCADQAPFHGIWEGDLPRPSAHLASSVDLTARDKFFFALLSPITFPFCLSPERLDEPVFLAWWNHIAYMVILTKHVISSEELEVAKRGGQIVLVGTDWTQTH